ncbi:hypothetical protein LWF15_03290 [Kineosporia rhizophila]|uniref:hypothetical protein n=1 Tax=Kineosporia rhizophila TaxID=84633 RepID=UPI001E391F82|nr:hypothetical protein [Kineosporia rhizophila]MCE0534521.1 hypothetical protein [Kineosporia rhizophila]
MSMLLDTVIFGLLLLAAGLPLTVFLGACAGLVWLRLDRVPGWFFLVGIAVCAAVWAGTEIWTAGMDESDPEIVVGLFVWLNALVALPALAIGWLGQRRFGGRGFGRRKSERPDSVSAARPLVP